MYKANTKEMEFLLGDWTHFCPWKVFYICSYGGSGSRMLETWLKNYGTVHHLHDPNPPDVVTLPAKNPYLQKEELDSWGSKELDLSRYKPYVIFIYSRPECSVWSRCEPTHWLCCHANQMACMRICGLLDIPYWVSSPGNYASNSAGGDGGYNDARYVLAEDQNVKEYFLNVLADCNHDIHNTQQLAFTRYGDDAKNINHRWSKKYLKLPHDYINYENFFRNYTCKRTNYDILCINYHHLWEDNSIEGLLNFCEIPLEDANKFPKQRTPSWERDSQTTLELEKAHDGIFKSLNNLINQSPPIGVLLKHEKKRIK